LEKGQKAHHYNQDIHDAYQKLSGVYNAANFSPEGDFSERLSTLSERLAKRYQEKYGTQDARRLTAGEVTACSILLRSTNRTVSLRWHSFNLPHVIVQNRLLTAIIPLDR
jgi:hypothetical protein